MIYLILAERIYTELFISISTFFVTHASTDPYLHRTHAHARRRETRESRHSTLHTDRHRLETRHETVEQRSMPSRHDTHTLPDSKLYF